MIDLWLFSGMKLRTKFDTIVNIRGIIFYPVAMIKAVRSK